MSTNVTPGRLTPQMIANCRAEFPGLGRMINNRPAVFFDGPAGTQVPQRVIDAVEYYLAHLNANHGGQFATSRESDELLEEVHRGVADFLGASDPDEVMFGANMTSLTFAFSRALSKSWKPGDEIVVTRLEHDANFTPWVLAAEDAGATVRIVDVDLEDTSLNLEDLKAKLNANTKFVAVTCASNATGTRPNIPQIAEMVHAVGAYLFVDAVHYAPHALIDVEAFGCDFLACSAYKFFAPHVGMMWGKRELLEKIKPYKLRPPKDTLPDCFMTGTQNHEGLAGTLEAIRYIEDLGRIVTEDDELSRRDAIVAAMEAIEEYEMSLLCRLLDRLDQIPAVKVYGITDRDRLSQRLPTISITHEKLPQSVELAKYLGDQGIYVWHGNYYAIPLTEVMGVEPNGMVRIGIIHYNTSEEIDRLADALEKL